MGTQRKNRESFVLVYADDGDPSHEETAEVLDHLKPFTVEEVVPGTFRIVGTRQEVERSVLDLSNWQLSGEKMFSLNPPYKSQVR